MCAERYEKSASKRVDALIRESFNDWMILKHTLDTAREIAKEYEIDCTILHPALLTPEELRLLEEMRRRND